MTYACPRCRGSRTSATFDRFRMDARQQDLLVGIENIVEMQNVEEEDFAISKSSGADAEFDMIIGNIEDIIMEEDFQHLQQSFMEKYYHEFDDTEENKLSYTTIFNEYIEILEKHLEQQLIERVPGFNMDAFTVSLKRHKDEVSGDILDMLLTFTDFIAFKEMFVDYRAEKEGRGLDLSTGLVVKSLNSASSASLTSSLASQSS